MGKLPSAGCCPARTGGRQAVRMAAALDACVLFFSYGDRHIRERAATAYPRKGRDGWGTSSVRTETGSSPTGCRAAAKPRRDLGGDRKHRVPEEQLIGKAVDPLEKDQMPPAHQHRPMLLDELPQFLDDLAEFLDDVRAGQMASEPVKVPVMHALERLEVGYDLAEVVEEYAILRRCIVELVHREGAPAMRSASSLGHYSAAPRRDAAPAARRTW